MTLEEAASELADALMAAKTQDYTKTWPITRGKDKERTDEEVQVIVVRRKLGTKTAHRIDESTTIQFYGSGRICGACGGTGRV